MAQNHHLDHVGDAEVFLLSNAQRLFRPGLMRKVSVAVLVATIVPPKFVVRIIIFENSSNISYRRHSSIKEATRAVHPV